MNLRDLRYIVAVADLKNFSKAAERCNVSQPTLSNQIRKLEEMLSTTIFERTNKRVMLTDIGEKIILSARRLLREEDTIRSIAELARDPFAGVFRLGAFPTLSTYIFPDIVPTIRQHFPKLKLVLIEEKTDQLLEHLRQGTLDAALLALPLHDDSLQTSVLFKDEFVLAVPEHHPLSNHSQIDYNDILNYKLLLLEEGHCLRDQALDICHITGLAQETDFRATGLETLRQMVKAGTGITLMPRIAIRPDEDHICYIPFTDPIPTRTIGLVWRKTSARDALIQQLIPLLPHS
jgi:LysR family hydrogen peroxide-inducible transcriptional activator